MNWLQMDMLFVTWLILSKVVASTVLRELGTIVSLVKQQAVVHLSQMVPLHIHTHALPSASKLTLFA